MPVTATATATVTVTVAVTVAVAVTVRGAVVLGTVAVTVAPKGMGSGSVRGDADRWEVTVGAETLSLLSIQASVHRP